MRVPDLARPPKAPECLDNVNSSINATSNFTINMPKRHRKPKGPGKPDAVVSMPDRTSRSTRAKAKAQVLDERQTSCPRGKAFYKCANGFTGCCSVNPCDPGRTCPDSQETGIARTTKPSSSKAAKPTLQASMSSKTGGLGRTSTTTLNKSSSTATPTVHATSTTAQAQSGPVYSPPPCPEGNRTIFHDSSHIMYRIHCGIDNTYASDDNFSVSAGGYGECFSACSKTSSCAGFTWVGEDSGDCYLKNQMPKNNYMRREDNNYISCSKLHPTASNPGTGNSTEPSSGSKTSLGAIVGGSVGAALFIVLLLLLIAFVAKRKKKEKEQRRATIVSHVTHGPIETTQLDPNAHHRQVSTSHDVFAPFGGFYRGFQDDTGWSGSNKTGHASNMVPPGGRAEARSFILPASVYQGPYEDDIPMLYSAPIEPRTSPPSGSRSPRFHEHLVDLNDTRSVSPTSQSYSANSAMADSPTLGRPKQPPPSTSLGEQVRRQQHMVSWNHYNPSNAARGISGGRTNDDVSPTSTKGRNDGKFNVSPLDSVDRGRFR